MIMGLCTCIIFVCFNFHLIYGLCTYPSDIRGTWRDSVYGTIIFSNSYMYMQTKGFLSGTSSTNFSCHMSTNNLYISKSVATSTLGIVGGIININVYICMEFTVLTSSASYYYYLKSRDAYNLNFGDVVPILSSTSPLQTDVCNTSPDIREFHMLVFPSSASLGMSKCPVPFLGDFTYTMNFGTGATQCGSKAFWNGCSNTSVISLNNTACGTQYVGFSSGGYLGCVYSVQDATTSSIYYVGVYNFDQSINGASTNRFTCFAVQQSSSLTNVSQSPDKCTSTQSPSSLPSNGALLQLTTVSSCAPPSLLTLQEVTTGNKILGTEGQSLTLRCTSIGGKPTPLVTITVDNVPKSAEQSVDYTISTLQRRHDGQVLRCDANSSALSSPMVATAILYLYLKPSQPIFSPDPISIEETKPLIVSCTSTGSRPQATFQWSIGMANVTSASTTQVTNTGNDMYTVISTLRYNMDRTYNGQTITCGAYNNVFNSGVNVSKTLDVKFAPNIKVTNLSYTQNTDTKTVFCNPDGNPTTYTYYRWQHKSAYGVLIRELAGGQNLTLPSVPEEARYQDSGEYVCTASNSIIDRDGKIQQSGSGYVTIIAEPVFTGAKNPTAYGVFGGYVDINVYVYSVPIYTSVNWFRGSTRIKYSDKYNFSESGAIVTDTFYNITVLLNGNRFTLTIKNLVESDFNVSYRLELYNGVGQPVGHTTLLVFASGPQTPVNFTISSYSQSSISFQWYPGYNGGHEQSFYVQYRVYKSNMWKSAKIVDTKQTIQTYILDGLQDGTSYELRMYAENRFNTSSPTDTQIIETIKDIPSSSTGAVFGGLAGGLATCTVLVILGLIIHFKRKQGIIKKNQKVYSERMNQNEDKAYENISGGNINDETSVPMSKEHVQDRRQNRCSSVLYESLGKKDIANVYDTLTDDQQQVPSKTYEELGMKDSPNTYDKLPNQRILNEAHGKTKDEPHLYIDIIDSKVQ